jgi:hypothetical protein
MVDENVENEVVICKGVVRNGNGTTFDLENYSLSELIPEIVSRFLSLDLSGEITRAVYDEAHSLAANCQFLEIQQSEDEVKHWFNSLLYNKTEMLPPNALMDAVAKGYPNLPSFALAHIKTVAKESYTNQASNMNTDQLEGLISFHLRSVLLPLWRKKELNAQLNRLHKLKKPTPTLEELTEQVNSLRLGLEKIQRVFDSCSRSFLEQSSANWGDSNDDIPF